MLHWQYYTASELVSSDQRVIRAMSHQFDAAARPRIDAQSEAGIRHRPDVVAGAGVFGALAASSCCILPLVLFTLGVSGAWIGNLTRLARYQPYFIAGTIALLIYGYRLAYRTSKTVCADAATCAQPSSSRVAKVGLFLATALVLAALGVDFLAPFLIDS